MKSLLLVLTLLLPFSLSAAPVLVSTDWLADNLKRDNIVVVDTSDATQHIRFHIPGAVHIDYSDIVYQRKQDKVAMAVPDQYFMQLLAQRGISNDSYVIIYDDMGGLNAGRLFWQLEQIGHEQVSVLDGGLVKWILEHRDVTNQHRKVTPVSYSENIARRHNNLASMNDLQDDKTLLIDARSQEEYVGLPQQPRSGHIPGATFWDWQDNVDFDNGFILKTSQQLAPAIRNIDLGNKQQSIITYCQSGHRASQSYLTLRSMGFEKVKVYDGSMAEYSQHKEAPLETGCQKC